MFCAAAAVVVVLIVLTAVNVKAERLSAYISPDFKAAAGTRYKENYSDLGVIRAVRGGDIKSVENETYIAVAGQVFSGNATRAAKICGDIVMWLPQLINGSKITILLTVTSVAAGLFFGIFLALGKISKFKPLSAVCKAYIFFFRGTPLLMQLYFLYYGLPQFNPDWVIRSRFLAGFIAFTLNSAAYCAELVRAAVQSIDKGQFEAAKAIGLTYGQTMKLIILPQSVRRLLPPVSNEFVMALKDVSLVSIIALSDLTHQTRTISSSVGSALVYLPAMGIYLVITAVFTELFRRIENRFALYE